MPASACRPCCCCVPQNYQSGSCSHTDGDSGSPKADDPWWTVDLGQTATVVAVVIRNRVDCCPGNSGGPQQPVIRPSSSRRLSVFVIYMIFTARPSFLYPFCHELYMCDYLFILSEGGGGGGGKSSWCSPEPALSEVSKEGKKNKAVAECMGTRR